MWKLSLAACALVAAAVPTPVSAGDRLWSGDWYLTLGGSGISGPTFQGSKERKLYFSPIISIGRAGNGARFSSRNDSPSVGLIETDLVRAGIAGRLVQGRDASDETETTGLADVPWGIELGGFVDVYPTEFLRGRAELRQGIHSHDGLVTDLSVDAFADIMPGVQLSAGPRARYATSGYTKAYYGVNAAQSAASGLSQYDAGGGWQSVGFGGAITWQATDRLSASAFAEYDRLIGVAADSSLVKERGTKNQVMVGVSASYKFGFRLD